MEVLAVVLFVAIFAFVVFAMVAMTIGHGVLFAKVLGLIGKGPRRRPIDGKCPSCGAPARDAAGDGWMRCDHCGQDFRPDSAREPTEQ